MSTCPNCYKKKYERDKVQFFNFKWDCREEGRCVFNTYDHHLCELYVSFFKKKLSKEEIIQLTGSIEKSYLTIKAHISLPIRFYDFPKTSEKFIDLIMDFNSSLFKETKINTLIGFRENSVYVDENEFAFEGVKPQKIKNNLTKLFEDILVNIQFSSMTKEQFCRKSAVFLEEFFRIHPFADGNGRVGRLFLILMARETKRFEFGRFTHHTDGSDHSYIKALRHAHKNWNSENTRKKGSAFADLIKWLDSKLNEISPDDLEDIPP